MKSGSAERKLGRLAPQAADGKIVTVAADGSIVLAPPQNGDAQPLQWVDIGRDQILLMSLTNHRYLLSRPGAPAVANHPVPRPDRMDGTCFTWSTAD